MLTAHDRLSVERIQRVIPDASILTNPLDYDRLLAIERGIDIHCPDGFSPNEARQPVRTKYLKEVSTAVNKLLQKQHDAGTCVLLPTEEVALIAGIHFSFIHLLD